MFQEESLIFLTGKRDELESHMASHMDVNALLLIGYSEKEASPLELIATENLKTC